MASFLGWYEMAPNVFSTAVVTEATRPVESVKICSARGKRYMWYPKGKKDLMIRRDYYHYLVCMLGLLRSYVHRLLFAATVSHTTRYIQTQSVVVALCRAPGILFATAQRLDPIIECCRFPVQKNPFLWVGTRKKALNLRISPLTRNKILS